MSKVCVRHAVGASMLTTALLIGAPMAVAMADGETGGSTGSSDTSPAPTSNGADASPGSAIKPGFDLGENLRTSLRNTMAGLGGIAGPWTHTGQQSGSRPGSSATGTSSSSTDTELELTPPKSAGSGTEASDTEQPTTQSPGTTTTGLSGSSSASHPAPVRPQIPSVVPPKPVQGPVDFEKLPVVAHTVGNTLASVLNSAQLTAAAVPALLVALPNSSTPVADVISTIQYMLTTVSTSVGTVAALPGELGSLMGVTTAPTAVVAMAPRENPVPLSAPVDLTGLMVPQAPASALGTDAVFAAPAAPVLMPSTPVTVNEVPPATVAPLGVSGLTASGAPESFLDRAVSTLLVPISIAALAAVALPGVGGLLVICALGVRIGYRQAKAGWAVRVAGIARFAGSGPMGIVRSGSMISLHSRRAAPTRGAAPALRLADQSFEQAA